MLLPVVLSLNQRSLVPRSTPRMATETNPSIAATQPGDFAWWSPECAALISELDAREGERFVASHDDEGFDTHNWLHVTSSSPLRRASAVVEEVLVRVRLESWRVWSSSVTSEL